MSKLIFVRHSHEESTVSTVELLHDEQSNTEHPTLGYTVFLRKLIRKCIAKFSLEMLPYLKSS